MFAEDVGVVSFDIYTYYYIRAIFINESTLTVQNLDILFPFDYHYLLFLFVGSDINYLCVVDKRKTVYDIIF